MRPRKLLAIPTTESRVPVQHHHRTATRLPALPTLPLLLVVLWAALQALPLSASLHGFSSGGVVRLRQARDQCSTSTTQLCRRLGHRCRQSTNRRRWEGQHLLRSWVVRIPRKWVGRTLSSWVGRVARRWMGQVAPDRWSYLERCLQGFLCDYSWIVPSLLGQPCRQSD